MKYLNLANHVRAGDSPEFLATLIDLSNSMESDDWKPTRKAGAIKANKELIRVKAQNHPQDKVAIIGFGTNAELLHDPVCLSDGLRSLNRTLRRLPSMGWTNFRAALELAEACLFGRPVSARKNTSGSGRSGFLSWLLYDQLPQASHHIRENSPSDSWVKRIILLTDGDYNKGGSPLRAAKRLKDAGVVIDCIGIGGGSEDVEEEKLKGIASRNTDGSVRYCFIGDKYELIRKYESLAHHIRPV